MAEESAVSLMLPHLPSFPLLVFTSVLFIYVFLKLWNGIKARKETPKLPPGPPKLPLIGNLHQLIIGRALPHHSLRDIARRYGPLMHLQLGEISTVIVSRPDTAQEVLKKQELSFAERPELLAVKIMSYDRSGIVFAPYGAYWREIRKICVMELLSAKRVRFFSSIIVEEVWSLMESLSSSQGKPINLTNNIFSLMNDITARAAFGKKCRQQAEFLSLLHEVMKFAGGFDIPDVFPSLKFLGSITGIKSALQRTHRKIDKILENIIDDHRANRKYTTRRLGTPDHDQKENDEEDILDVLLDIQESSKLDFSITNKHIKAIIMDIFSAGTETSATTLDWLMSELVRNPRVMAKAQAEVREAFQGKNKIKEADVQKLDYLKLLIKETLRLHPPGTLLPREARESCDIGEYHIPKKTKLIINVWAMARDESHWGANAEYFDPDRFLGSSIDFKGTNFELLPFGAGRRMCRGISFASAQLELALAQLLYHFDWKLPNEIQSEKLDMTESFGITTRRKNDLYLIAIPHIPFEKM